ncbi:unnamed protein product [Coffea canephora]|uniref:Uncharacterized protein n=1 Tax=Coffea canephora TaxID=49390 RepID=A0A068U9Z2_COFCA|nr:unnamed protein product [Coffea canephora]
MTVEYSQYTTVGIALLAILTIAKFSLSSTFKKSGAQATITFKSDLVINGPLLFNRLGRIYEYGPC